MTSFQCCICFDNVQTGTSHCFCSTKCGHIFGRSCIEKWIKTKRKCPVCNRTTRKSDLRDIYLDNILSIDNSSEREIERLKSVLSMTEKKAEKIQNDYDVLWLLYSELIENDTKNKPFEIGDKNYFQFSTEFDLSFYKKVRSFGTMDYSPLNHQLLLSSKNADYFGIQAQRFDDKRIESNEAFYFSKSPIRSIKTSKYNNNILVTSLENGASMIDFKGKNIACKFKGMIGQCYSCEWHNNIYAYFTTEKSIYCYDIRNPITPLYILCTSYDTPIHSIYYNPSTKLKTEGILVASRMGIDYWYYNQSNSMMTCSTQTTLSGYCSSLYIDTSIEVGIASFDGMDSVSHKIFELDKNESIVVSKEICGISCPKSNYQVNSHVFELNNQIFAVFYDPQSKSDILFNATHGKVQKNLLSNSITPSVKYLTFNDNGKLYLATLRNDSLHIYS